jgi:ribosomal protein S18 acetylase RimI-like enzyme
MLIRAAQLSDAPTLVEYVIAEAREAEAREVARETATASVGAALADPALMRYWLAEEDGAPVAAISVTREWSDWRNAAYWWIQFVFVVPERRGQGLLRALVEHVRAEAVAAGAAEVRLYVHPENTRAVRAYEKLGFEPLPYRMMALR